MGGLAGLATELGIKGWEPQAYGVWTLVILVAAFLIREWRETRKLSADDRLARREGYAKQVEGLQRENRELRGELAEVRAAHDDYRRLCHAETDQLRAQVINLQTQVAGFERALSAKQIADIRNADEKPSPMVRDAAERSAQHKGLAE